MNKTKIFRIKCNFFHILINLKIYNIEIKIFIYLTKENNQIFI